MASQCYKKCKCKPAQLVEMMDCNTSKLEFSWFGTLLKPVFLVYQMPQVPTLPGSDVGSGFPISILVLVGFFLKIYQACDKW